MKLNKTVAILSITALFFSVLQYFKTNQQKIAYVFVEEVIAEYHAMQDVNDKFQVEEATQKEKLDAFYQDIQEKIGWLQENHKTLKKSTVTDKQHEIVDLEKALQQMQQKTYKELDSIKISWTSPIYEEVNQYIKNYSQQKGYDYVLGNLGNGNMMYGNPVYNLTLEVIDGMNTAYNKKNMQQ